MLNRIVVAVAIAGGAGGNSTDASAPQSEPSKPESPRPEPPKPKPEPPACVWQKINGDVQGLTDPRSGATCFVKATEHHKVDVSSSLRGSYGSAHEACTRGPAPKFIATVDGDGGMLTYSLGRDEVLCKHGQGASVEVLIACNCAP